MSKKYFKSFTMAEILIGLTIIGVVAALVLPAVLGNVNEKTWIAQRKGLHTRLSQAIGMMQEIGNYGIKDTEQGTINNASMIFLENGLRKVYDIKKICNVENMKKCGIPDSYTDTNGNTISFPQRMQDLHSSLYGEYITTDESGEIETGSYTLLNTVAAAVETLNGESLAVFYQPYCKSSFGITNSAQNTKVYAAPFMCVNFIYDLNGDKGPNTAGKDIGYITAFYPTDSHVVMPIDSLNSNLANESSEPYSTLVSLCSDMNKEWRLPNLEEMISMAVNSKISNILITENDDNTNYATANSWRTDVKNLMWFKVKPEDELNNTVSSNLRCVKK